MLPLPRVGNYTIFCVTSAFVNGKIGVVAVDDIATTLADDYDWGVWDAKAIASQHGVLGSGPNGAFVTSAYRA